MSLQILTSADRIYQLAAKQKSVHVFKVNHSSLNSLLATIRQLKLAVGHDSVEVEWGHFFMRVKRFSHSLIWNPIPFSFSQPLGPDWLQYSENFLSRCRTGYPDCFHYLDKTVSSISELIGLEANPLLDEYVRVSSVQATRKIAIMVRDLRFASVVTAELTKRRLDPIDIITYNDLQADQCYSSITLFGGNYLDWVPPFVYDAPRADHVSIILWGESRSQPSANLLPNYGLPLDSAMFKEQEARKTSHLLIEQPSSVESHTDERINPILALESWQDDEIDEVIRRSSSGSFAHTSGTQDARLFILEGRNVTFLSNSPEHKITSVDIDGLLAHTDSGGINKIEINDLRIGDFIVLRTQGAGDLVVDIANKLLGPRHVAARANQFRWKTSLSTEVMQSGLLTTSIQLIELGSLRANEQNVRNWISEDSIRPDLDEDFLAILRLVGMENMWEDMVNDARAIDSAHRSAGHRIRRALLDKAAGLDVDMLVRTGRVDIELGEQDAGTLTIIRVVGRTEKITSVPSHLIQKVISIDDSFYDLPLSADKEQ